MTENQIIQDACNNNHKVLEKQIENITLRQQELQNHISRLESNVMHLEQIVATEKQQPKPNHDRIKGCYIAISKNIELIAKLYECYNRFEDVKFKYHKQISESNYKYIHLLEVEIRRIEESLDRDIESGGFSEVMRVLMEGFKQSASQKAEMIKEYEEDLNEDPQYKL